MAKKEIERKEFVAWINSLFGLSPYARVRTATFAVDEVPRAEVILAEVTQSRVGPEVCAKLGIDPVTVHSITVDVDGAMVVPREGDEYKIPFKD